ncbi:carbohydrate-binding family 9-like protein [Anaerocolumna xylanovorans]|uniref:Carbohydrate-binding family 9 n=1 Tax=Anaerocolumna xylanovorans DSM 12503 TaxID=1121345 RepID=A0A1M7Y794_9FIRM|nr:carbohydrate-binding family 9-like protein [Anaerocolumna xylanovorans]SHO48396.1 Carbohydrate-binding family 9 [Anaerocolumna xylanovorans DSM 12503]
MAYRVYTITDLEQLEECAVFCIDHYQWTQGGKPKAYGRMGLLKDYGLIISMTAIEANPLRTFTKENDPVYMDSALEAFLSFSGAHGNQKYMNFEMNANGALLSAFGTVTERKFINEYTGLRALCETNIEKDRWTVLLKIPMELTCSLYGREPLQSGDSFTCNFYKICETPEYEHYASFAPIISEKPNFHLPEFFKEAVIV